MKSNAFGPVRKAKAALQHESIILFLGSLMLPGIQREAATAAAIAGSPLLAHCGLLC